MIDLRVERLNRGLSVEQFAKELDVAPHVLRHAEEGGRPRPASALKIASFYGYQVTDIWPVDREPDSEAA